MKTQGFPIVARAAGHGSTFPRALPASPVVRQSPRRPGEHLRYVRRVETVVDVRRLQETVIRNVEETLERKMVERMKTAVARELSSNVAYERRLSERIYNGLHDNLILEKERLGWR